MNGNNVLEYEEDNIDMLEEKFLLNNAKEFLKYLIDTNSLDFMETVIDNFKESHEDEWNELLDEEWNHFITGDN